MAKGLCRRGNEGEDFLQVFGVNLRKARLRKGVTLGGLASSMGLSSSALRHYERGIREPGLFTFHVLCKRLNVSPHKLLGRLK